MQRATLAVFAALLVPYAWLVQRYWFVCDDAFITFRFSRNLALGNGPRYNLGDHVPVEGYSNFLWMLIAAGFEAVGIEPHLAMPWLSVLTGVALIALLLRVLLVHAKAPLPIAFTAVAAAMWLPPMGPWSTSGLATMPLTFGLFAAWAILSLEDDDRAPIWAGVAALGLALVRTEGIAWAIVVGVLAALQRRLEGRPVARPLLTYAAVLLLPYLAYFGWRASYYESWVANTAKAKVHLQPATLLRGLEYLGLYVTTLVTPALLLVAFPITMTSKRVSLALAAGALAFGVPAYAMVVSGDYMTWFRLLVPGLPFMAVVFGLAATEVTRRREGMVLPMAVVLGITALVGHLPAHDVHLFKRKVRKPFHIRDKLGYFRDENEQWDAMREHAEHWRDKGEALATVVTPDDTYVAAAIGATGYYSGVYIYDRNGLVNREVAEQPWNGQLRSPGHDKVVDRSFFYEMQPTILDSKLLEGKTQTNGTRVRTAVIQGMESAEVQDRYFPEIHRLPKRDGVKGKRLLVLLRLAPSPEAAQAGWERYKAALDELDS